MRVLNCPGLFLRGATYGTAVNRKGRTGSNNRYANLPRIPHLHLALFLLPPSAARPGQATSLQIHARHPSPLLSPAPPAHRIRLDLLRRPPRRWSLPERGAASMGVHLSTPKTEKYSQDGEGGRVRYGLASMQGWRTTMEDAHAALPELDECTSFFGVFDGHGGKSVAKFCAKYLHVQVLQYEAKSSGDLATAVKKAYFRIDEMMKGHRGWRELNELGDKGQKFAGMLEGMIWSPKVGDSGRPWDGWSEEGPHSDFEGPTCGSTACVAIIRNDQLVVANAGDSRCVISRKGQAHDLSRDHKPDLATERERIKDAGGFVVAGRVNGSLNLTRAIGDMELKTNDRLPADRQIVSAEPEVKIVQLSDDDEFIVLACDGIWDCMSSQEVVDFVHEKLRTEDSLSAVCEMMLDRCLAPEAGGEGCDNMTVIVVQLKKRTKSAATTGTTSSAEESVSTTEELRPNEPEEPTSSSK